MSDESANIALQGEFLENLYHAICMTAALSGLNPAYKISLLLEIPGGNNATYVGESVERSLELLTAVSERLKTHNAAMHDVIGKMKNTP